MKKILEENEEEEKTPQTYKNALLDGIDQYDSSIIDEKWDKLILAEEKEKFLWHQTFNFFLEFFAEKDIFLSPDDRNVYDFFKENIKATETNKTKEHNGFTYKGKKIVKRKSEKTFVFVESPALNDFLGELKNLGKDANAIISENLELYTDSITNKQFANKYIEELREEQKRLVNEASEDGEYFEMQAFNEISREIENVRENKNFKIRAKIWSRSLGGKITRLGRYLKSILWRNKLKTIGFLIGLASLISSIIAYEKTVKFLKSASSQTGKIILAIDKTLKKYIGKGVIYTVYTSAAIALGYIYKSLLFMLLKPGILLFKIMWGSVLSLLTNTLGVIIIILFSSIATFTLGATYVCTRFYVYGCYLTGEIPTKEDETLKYIAKNNNLSPEDFLNHFFQNKSVYNNYFAYVIGIILKTISSILIGGSNIITDKILDISALLFHYLKYVTLFFGIILIIYILNKWRN